LEHIFSYIESHRVAPKIKPLSNYKKIVLNRIKAYKRDYIIWCRCAGSSLQVGWFQSAAGLSQDVVVSVACCSVCSVQRPFSAAKFRYTIFPFFCWWKTSHFSIYFTSEQIVLCR